MKKTFKILTIFAAAALAMSGAAHAAGGKTKELKHHDWSFNGIFGTYDKEAVQRGFQVYREVCAACHSLDLIAFRHLGDKGGPYYMDKCPAELIELGLPETTDCSNPNANPVVRAFAAEYTITDGPDDEGDMFERPGVPADYVPGPYANKQQAASANGGAIPPDMSLLAKARPHGPDYIYSLLTGYPADGELPKELEIPAGQYYNPYYPGDTLSLMKPEYLDEEGNVLEGVKQPYGGVFKMKNPLIDGMVDYVDDSIPETVEQYAEDVTYFMMWAAEPKMEARKRMGMITMIYLFIFAGILYASYKQIWRDVEH
jgi:cytochrome c1